MLLIADENQQIVGKPTIEGARVFATAKGEGKDKKIVIFKYKNKTRNRNKTGHRQIFTALSIDKIVQSGEEVEQPKKARRTKKEVAEDGA